MRIQSVKAGAIKLLAVGRRFAEEEIQKLRRLSLDRAGTTAVCGHHDAAELLQSGELRSSKEVVDRFSCRVGDGEVEFR